MAVIVQESGVWQNRMSSFGQECGKWLGSTGSAKIKKFGVHMMITIFSCVRLSLSLERRTLFLLCAVVVSNGCACFVASIYYLSFATNSTLIGRVRLLPHKIHYNYKMS
jgi:hypothetical protein